MIKTKDEDPQLPDSVKEVLGRTIACFFAACGMDEAGKKITDRKSIMAGREGFLKYREEFSRLIREEDAKRKRKLIEDFRREKGLKEELSGTEGSILTDHDSGAGTPRGADPEVGETVLSALIEVHPKEAEEHQGEIGFLKKEILAAGRKAAALEAGKEALLKEVMKVYFDEAVDWDVRWDLRQAFLFSTFETDEKIRELLYTVEAARYQVRWLLGGEAVDDVLFDKINGFFSASPDVLNPGGRLGDLAGYVHPPKDQPAPAPVTEEPGQVFQGVSEIKRYISEHPEQFEAQSLLSAVSLSKEYYDCVAKASSLSLAADAISSSEKYRSLDKENKVKFFLAWALSDAVSRTGNTMTDFLLTFENRTVKEASAVFARILPQLCFSRVMKQSKESLGVIMMERSGFHVPEEKDRFLEYFGL